MHLLFPAIKARFDGDSQLKRLCGTLWQGFAGDRVRAFPYAEAHRIGGSDELDPWGVDVETEDVQFSIFTKHVEPDRCAEILWHFQRVYDDAQLESTHFTAVQSSRLFGPRGPTLIDGTYTGSIDYRFSYQLAANWPLNRWATST